jgi:uncharacterized membrane protein
MSAKPNMGNLIHERWLVFVISFLEFTNPVRFNLDGAAVILFYFMIYALVGWLLENSYSYITKRKFFKSNFFLGPFKPMYGFAPVLLVLLIGPETKLVVILLLCFFIPTFIEYLSGALLQKLFHQQWWDYSDMPLQLHGHICLPFSLCWILLSVICIKWLHPVITSFYGIVEPLWAWVWPAVGLYFIAELALAIRRHSSQALTPEPTNPIQ